MLNPSTADASSDDPTIRRCKAFALRWGMSELRVVNLFALKATDPQTLYADSDPVGPENDEVIAEELENADRIVIAWGNHGSLGSRAEQVRNLISFFNIEVHCLGMNVTGEPRHPLYVSSDAVLSSVNG